MFCSDAIETTPVLNFIFQKFYFSTWFTKVDVQLISAYLRSFHKIKGDGPFFTDGPFFAKIHPNFVEVIFLNR